MAETLSSVGVKRSCAGGAIEFADLLIQLGATVRRETGRLEADVLDGAQNPWHDALDRPLRWS